MRPPEFSRYQSPRRFHPLESLSDCTDMSEHNCSSRCNRLSTTIYSWLYQLEHISAGKPCNTDKRRCDQLCTRSRIREKVTSRLKGRTILLVFGDRPNPPEYFSQSLKFLVCYREAAAACAGPQR